MIETYYDINKKDDFDGLFKGLYIGDNPTEKRNSYLVWKISFAGIENGNSKEHLRESFNFRVLGSMQEFIRKYADLLKLDKIPDLVNSAEKAIELKHIKESERTKLNYVKEEGIKQLKSYVESKKIKCGFKDEELKKVLIVVVGKKDVYVEGTFC